jgi:hypothetical protein
MILDKRNEFCDAVALNTGAAGTYLVGDQIDLGAVARDVGNGEPMFLVITVDTLPTSAGAATAQFQLASDASAAIATNGTATVHLETKAFAISEMAAGTMLAAIALPLEGVAYERYLGVLQVTGTAAFTGGKINAFLTHDVAKWKSYDAPFQA